MRTVVVQILSLRPMSNSGVVFARRFLPEFVRAYGPEDVIILCDSFGRSCVGDAGCRFEIVRTPDFRIARKAAIRWHLPRLVARSGASVVFSPDVPAIGAPLDVPAVIVLHSHLHLSQPEGQPWGRRLYWKLWYVPEFVRDARRAAALIAPTAAFAAEFESLVPGTRAKTAVVHHGVAKAFVPSLRFPPPSDEQAPPRVLFVGNGMTYKNPVGALRIFEAATRGLPHVLRMAGIGEAELAGLAAGAGLSREAAGRVQPLGLLDETRLVAEYQAASALLLPSRVESFGLPALEAMASGLPVACSDLPSLAEVTGGAAALSRVDDIEAFAASLRAVLVDGAQALRMRAAGLARAAAFSWEKCGREAALVVEQAGRRG